MGTCMARRGFLTLSDCENPATTACSQCGRMMCPAHLSPSSGFSMCLDCAATQQQPGEKKEGEGEEVYDDEWAHRYRDDYYTSSRYVPFYTGSHSDSYYDDQDVRSFDESEQALEEDEADRGGFAES